MARRRTQLIERYLAGRYSADEFCSLRPSNEAKATQPKEADVSKLTYRVFKGTPQAIWTAITDPAPGRALRLRRQPGDRPSRGRLVQRRLDRGAEAVRHAEPDAGGGWQLVLSDLKTIVETGSSLAGK